jgi:hypothetical protein
MMDLDLVVKYFPTEGQVGYIRYIGYYFMLNLTLGLEVVNANSQRNLVSSEPR